jgi:hypothetical protein
MNGSSFSTKSFKKPLRLSYVKKACKMSVAKLCLQVDSFEIKF